MCLAPGQCPLAYPMLALELLRHIGVGVDIGNRTNPEEARQLGQAAVRATRLPANSRGGNPANRVPGLNASATAGGTLRSPFPDGPRRARRIRKPPRTSAQC
jgi:hypothetical protein